MLASSVTPAFAQKINIKESAPGKLGDFTVPGIISGFVKLLVIGAAIIFFFWLVLGGIKWIMSGGDKTKTEEARNQITAALIGLVIVFSAWAITQLITVLFGVNLFELKFEEFPKQ